MALGAEHVGRRVVVRRRLPAEKGPSGGPAMTDVLGVLDSLTEQTLRVRRDDGEVVTVDRAEVVAAKPVPPRAPGRVRISPDDLQLVCAAGWHGPDQQRLGAWLLRAAGGFTGRANSVLPAGEPGMPLDAALERVDQFYRSRGLPVQAQVVVGSAVMEVLEARHWTRTRPDEADTAVRVAAVPAPRPLRHGDPGPGHVRLHDSPTDAWLARYSRSAGADEEAVRLVLSSGALVTFAQLGEPALAVGRAVVTGRWLGLSAVEVEPTRRRRGLGSEVVTTLLGWGAARGARWAYLQLLEDNDAALALSGRHGFTTHHSYRYLRPPR